MRQHENPLRKKRCFPLRCETEMLVRTSPDSKQCTVRHHVRCIREVAYMQAHLHAGCAEKPHTVIDCVSWVPQCQTKERICMSIHYGCTWVITHFKFQISLLLWNEFMEKMVMRLAQGAWISRSCLLSGCNAAVSVMPDGKAKLDNTQKLTLKPSLMLCNAVLHYCLLK